MTTDRFSFYPPGLSSSSACAVVEAQRQRDAAVAQANPGLVAMQQGISSTCKDQNDVQLVQAAAVFAPAQTVATVPHTTTILATALARGPADMPLGGEPEVNTKDPSRKREWENMHELWVYLTRPAAAVITRDAGMYFKLDIPKPAFINAALYESTQRNDYMVPAVLIPASQRSFEYPINIPITSKYAFKLGVSDDNGWTAGEQKLFGVEFKPFNVKGMSLYPSIGTEKGGNILTNLANHQPDVNGSRQDISYKKYTLGVSIGKPQDAALHSSVLNNVNMRYSLNVQMGLNRQSTGWDDGKPGAFFESGYFRQLILHNAPQIIYQGRDYAYLRPNDAFIIEGQNQDQLASNYLDATKTNNNALNFNIEAWHTLGKQHSVYANYNKTTSLSATDGLNTTRLEMGVSGHTKPILKNLGGVLYLSILDSGKNKITSTLSKATGGFSLNYGASYWRSQDQFVNPDRFPARLDGSTQGFSAFLGVTSGASELRYGLNYSIGNHPIKDSFGTISLRVRI